jgi:CBS domain-containing protein
MNDKPISTLMQPRTLTIAFDDKVPAIETFFTNNNISWAPVIGDTGETVGVISASDLLRFHANKGDPNTAAWRLCSYRPLSVSSDTSIAAVARLMLEHNIHHVVVTNRGTLCGVVSSLDFVRLLA